MHEIDKSRWDFLPVGENCIHQFVFINDNQRLKFTENPDFPKKEFEAFIKGKESFSLLLLPPCSDDTIELAKANFSKVLIVDYSQDRLAHVTYSEKLLVQGEDDFKDKLREYSEAMSYGDVISYMPQRYRKLDSKMSHLLDDVLIELQKEYCSFAVNKSLKRWHRNLNTVKNIQNERELILDLPDLKGQDVVIVGAGPSLDETISKLKKFRKRYCIIATDGSLRTLLNNDVLPDIIASCEDSLLSWQFFRSHIERLKTISLVAPYNANHYLLQKYTGALYLTKGVHNEEWVEEILDSLPLVEPGRCVGHYAFNLAIAINAGRIVMTGFDLSFKGEFFHPKDMPVPYFHEMDLPVPTVVKSIHGEFLKTDLSMLTYLKDFEYMISQTALQVIDATEGGAFKKGTIVKSLNQVDYKGERGFKEKSPVKVSFASRLKLLYQNSITFKDELLRAFTSYLVQQSNTVLDSVKEDDIASSSDLCELLFKNNHEKRCGISAMLIESESAAGELFEKFSLPKMKVIKTFSLNDLIREIRLHHIDHIYCINGNVPPDIVTIENLSCTDLKTNSELVGMERNLWLDGYESICTSESFEFWRGFMPVDIPVRSIQDSSVVEKVS